MPTETASSSSNPLPEGSRPAGLERLPRTLRLNLLAGLVGVIAGLGAIVFFEASEALFHWLSHDVAGYTPVPPRGEGGEAQPPEVYAGLGIDPFWALVLPTIGGLIVGILCTRFAPEAKGHGTDAAVGAYHHKGGVVHPRVIWVKTVASCITLGTFGSGGREGPIAQIGGGFGSLLAGMLKLGPRERRILLAVGMGAGVSAIFRAPLAGALFAAEILYRDSDFEGEVIMPSLLGCILSYSVFTAIHGQGTLFAADTVAASQWFVFGDPLELFCYLGLALVLTGFVHLYVRSFFRMEALFEGLRMPVWLKPALGGLLTGAFALALLHLTGDGRTLSVLGFGYGAIQEGFDMPQLLDGAAVPWGLIGMFFLVALGKIVTTGLTIGSGGSAGVFGPSMVIGGAIGTAVGLFFHALFPDLIHHPGAFTIVGMAGFFTGVAHTPISTILMVSEMTGNYGLVVPAMGVAVVCFALCHRVTIYGQQVPGRRDSPAHRGEFIVDVLEGIRVDTLRQSFRAPERLPATMSLRAMITRITGAKTHYYVVVGDDDALVGVLSVNDVRPYLNRPDTWDLFVASDIMTAEVLSVTPADDLRTVMRRFTQKNIDEIPVVDPDDHSRVLGMLRRREVIAAYNREATPNVDS